MGHRQTTPPLARGARVVLRRVTRADRDALLEINRVSQRLHRPWVSPPRTAAAFARYAARFSAPDFVALAVCDRGSGAIAGIVNVSQIVMGPLRSAYLGYYGNAALAGRGLMTEGLALAVRHCFRALRLHRVEANIQPGNHASRRLAARVGFTHEGFSRRYLKLGGRWRDHERWALLREDFRAAPAPLRRRWPPSRAGAPPPRRRAGAACRGGPAPA